MVLNDEYNLRVADVKAFYEVLKFLDGVETYKYKPIKDTNTSKSLLLTRNMQKCLRAEAIIVLYNLIESTFSNCVFFVYDNIKDEKLHYENLSSELRKVWFREKIHSKLSLDNARKISQNIADSLTSELMEFKDLPSDISGNLDLKKIITLCNTLGVKLGRIPDLKRTGAILLSIKSKRNDLAHGNKSFSGVGSLLTYNELEDYKEKTLSFLNFLIHKFQEYVSQKKFKI